MNPMPHARRKPLFFVLILLCLAGVVYAAGGGPPAAVDREATQADVVLLAVYILLALVFSFLCSVAEAVLLSITPSYIAGLREENPKRAALLRKLKQENVDRSLAAILTLNTIAHTVGAIGSGAKATVVFGSEFFGIFSALMTLLILFLSEIIPKTLGAVNWRRLAAPTALFVKGLIFMLYPLILVSEQLTKLIAHGKSVHAFSREEFQALAGIGEEQGHINEDESRIIHNLFRLETLVAEDIMTPRTVMVSLPASQTAAETVDTIANSPFSRLPVYGENRDQISGFVLKADVLLNMAREQGVSTLAEMQRDMPSVPKSMRLDKLLEFLLDERSHIAMVVDEYGGTHGLVTLEDLVETLLGMEIVDEADQTEDMQAMARRQWEKRARSLGLVLDDDEPEDESGVVSKVEPAEE